MIQQKIEFFALWSHDHGKLLRAFDQEEEKHEMNTLMCS
jgi:hypothetical protein